VGARRPGRRHQGLHLALPYASVVPAHAALSHLDRAFTYRVPDGMTVEVGSWVRVPFRRRNRDGIVVELLDEADVPRALDIADVLGPGLGSDLVELCRWVSDRYLSTLGEALAAATPDRVVDEERALARGGRAPRKPAVQSLGFLRRYRNGPAVERSLTGDRYHGFSWRPGADRAGEIAALAATTAAQGRGVLVLMPEVRFGGETADALHHLGETVAWVGSDRPARERYRAWLALRTGRAWIAAGGRAAVYAPVQNLGLVIVDDESHVSYKERRAPRINARAVAVERARRAGATLLMVGVPPSIEAGAAVEQRTMTAVAMARNDALETRPPVTVVDRTRDDSGLVPHAETLRIAAEELRAGNRVVLLTHRGGEESRRIAQRAFRILKPATPARLDARTSVEDLTKAIELADCIVATPVIAKDVDIDRVGLFAIMEADAALAVPEFRGAEEAFSTWWRAAPWARRIAIETAQPDHPAIRALVRWDPDALYRWEAGRRRETGYPPFAGLARIDVPPDHAPEVAEELRKVGGLTVLGPAEREGKAVVVVRAKTRNALLERLRGPADRWRADGEPVRVDVDPREVLP